MKGTVASGINKGKLRSQVAAENYLHGHRTSGDSVFNSQVLKEILEADNKKVILDSKKLKLTTFGRYKWNLDAL